MIIRFRTRKLQKEYEDGKKAVKSYGEQVGRKYVQRVGLLKQARTLEEVMALPGLDCHPLKGNRQGRWAIKLTGFYRLIFTLKGDALDIVCIKGVSKHYED